MSLPGLNEIEPKELFAEFYEICKVPHPSGHVEKIAAALKARAEAHGLKAELDKAGNLLIIKEADPGFEQAPVVCIQGHMDMVANKHPDKVHDFLVDPIVPHLESVDGELRMYADKTTLGGDDGTGLATCLAIAFDKTLKTGRLELFCTVDEETTMYGVHNMEAGYLKAKYLINCDSEDAFVITVGSCGGQTCNLGVDASKLHIETSAGAQLLMVKVSAGTGGHSGICITESRANAIKAAFRVADRAVAAGACIVGVKAGVAHNAIPSEANVALCFVGADAEAKRQAFLDEGKKVAQGFLAEYKVTDPALKIELLTECCCQGQCDRGKFWEKHLDAAQSRALVDVVLALPHGVLRMSPVIKGAAESSCNLAKVMFCCCEPETSLIQLSCRSDKTDFLDAFDGQMHGVARLSGFLTYSGCIDRYNGWSPKEDSKLLELTKKFYTEEGREPKVEAIHAGLECGELIFRHPGMEAVSIGPTIRNPHTDQEYVDVHSCVPYYNVVKKLVVALAQLKE